MGDSSDTEKDDDPPVEIVTKEPGTGSGTELVRAPSAALAASIRRAEEYRRSTKAESTRTAYENDWKRFLSWAEVNEATPLPATPVVLCAHLTWLAEQGYAVSSIERFLASAAHYHREVQCDFPRGSYIIGQTLENVRRKVGTKQKKKAPLGLKALAEICGRLQRQSEGLDLEGRLQNLQDRALLTVGWWCMLRSTNLVAIRREHVRFVRFIGDEWVDDIERPEGLIVHLPESKTDQRKAGRDVAVHAQDDETVCPVRTLAGYLRDAPFESGDLIFDMCERTVSRRVKRLVADPNHEHQSLRAIDECPSCAAVARQFASHSLRRGSATTQAIAGVAERDIMRQGGWKSERVMRGYIEHATIFQNNSTKGLAKK